MCDELVRVLKKALLTLSMKFPLSANLSKLVSRDFSLISQREAYDTLRYLLNSCGLVAELNDSSFSDVRWKSADPDFKRRIEKCKRYVFDSIKNLSKENKVSIPNLKMSDLPVPYTKIYFNTCIALANYALSYQLGNYGLYFWPRSDAYESIKMFYSNIKEEECHQFELQQEKLLKETRILEEAISKLKDKKTKIDSLLDHEISKCKYSCALKEESERSRILESWKGETDELHRSNLEKIKTLEDLNGQLALLSRLVVKKEKFVISGDELRKNIHFEVENFAEMNGLPLIKENHLDIPALFKVVHLTLPKSMKNREILRELLSLKLPVIDTGLLSKLESQKKRLEERCEDFQRHFGEENMTEATTWLKNFLFYIPKVEFSPLHTTTSARDPIFDEVKLLRFSEPSEKSSQCKRNNFELAARKGKDILHRFRDLNTKNSKKKDVQMAVKRDSKKTLRRIARRKSISLINLSTLSATSIKSSKSEKVDSPCGSEGSQKSSGKLCSTPKENHNRSSFMYDRNISPISVLSAKDKSFLSENRISEIDVTLNEGDVQASLLNSYLSADLDYKSENKQDTFDFSNSRANLTLDLDSSPSGISMSCS